MKLKSLVGCTLWIVLTVCPMSRLQAGNGAREVQYSSTDIIPIRAKIRFSTLIILPAEEEILDFTTGDKDFWIINGTHNLCYLHPARSGIRSNMNLVTASGHVYSFLLVEISKDTKSEPDLKVFVRPNDQSGAAGNPNPARYVRASEAEAYRAEVAELRQQLAQDRQRVQDQAARQVDEYRRNYPARLEFDYRLGKRAELAPFLVSAIYHDDRFTYIKSTASEKPTIYEIKDNKPNLVNFDLERGVYVVSKVVDRGYLVVGRKRVMFNRHGN